MIRIPPAIPPASQLPDVMKSYTELKQRQKAEERARNASVTLWTKVAAIAAVIGALAAIAAAILAFVAWRYPPAV